MGIGAGYGGSLKGSDGFNQSAFGRASQTAGQNMNKGLNYSPTLPQHESGNSQGYTRSVLSEGNITIGGKKTSARALGIHTDSATAHHGADSVPDLQNLLDKQQTVAQSTAAIHSAVGTYRGNRAKAATQELEKQQAAYEGRLKEQNDGSYEHYLSLSDAQRQQEMLAHSPAYAQAYQEARSWGIGGSKSRALSAAETLITGALGGQGDLQLAANTLAPYAAAAIGKRFGHGEHKNEAAQAIGHFMLGAALAYANGADPLAGGSAAVAAERAAEYLAKQYDDGKTAIDPITGKFNPNLLPEHIKEEIKAQTGAIASVVGAAGGSLNGTSGTNTNALFNAQVGGVLGQNAVGNNLLAFNLKSDPKAQKNFLSKVKKELGGKFELRGTGRLNSLGYEIMELVPIKKNTFQNLTIKEKKFYDMLNEVVADPSGTAQITLVYDDKTVRGGSWITGRFDVGDMEKLDTNKIVLSGNVLIAHEFNEQLNKDKLGISPNNVANDDDDFISSHKNAIIIHEPKVLDNSFQFIIENAVINGKKYDKFYLNKKQNKITGIIFGTFQNTPRGKIHIFQPYQEVINPNKDGKYKFINPDNPNDYIIYP